MTATAQVQIATAIVVVVLLLLIVRGIRSDVAERGEHGTDAAEPRGALRRHFVAVDAPLRDYLARRGESLGVVLPAVEGTAMDAFCRLGVGQTMVAVMYPDQDKIECLEFANVGQISYSDVGDGRLVIAFWPPGGDSLRSEPLKLYAAQATALGLEFLKGVARSALASGHSTLCFNIESAPQEGDEPKRLNWIEGVLRDEP